MTELSYPTGAAPRARGALTQARIAPGAGGRNGSAEFLTSPVVNDPRTNLPTRITDPRGGVTEIARTPGGLPQSIRIAAGTPDQAQTSFAYSPFGQPVTLTNDQGHTVRLDYAATGPAAGYLQRATADPGGLNLVTRSERDARGNVIATVDARGVRNEYDYNELDWLVEERLAVTPSADGAPALGYRSTSTTPRAR